MYGGSVGNSNGNSFSNPTGCAVKENIRKPACWKFGIAPEAMMAGALGGGIV